MRRARAAFALFLFATSGLTLVAQSVSFRAETLSVLEGQADLKCVQVGIFMLTSGYDGSDWNQLNLSVEWSDPNLILRDIPRGRLSRFAGSQNGGADNFGLTNPAIPLPNADCIADDTLNTVTLGNRSAIMMMRNTANPSAGVSGSFFVEEPNEVNQRITFGLISLSPDTSLFRTQDGVETLMAIVSLPLKANLSEGDILTLSFQAGMGNNTISFLSSGGTVTADSEGNNTSGTITIEPCGAVGIQSQPADITTCDGGDATFSVAVSGTGPFSFQWRKDNANVVGATGSSLTLTNVSPDDTGSYDCLITNSCGQVTSESATLAVDPFVVSTLQDTFTQGLDPITLTVETECGVNPVMYEWRELPSGNLVSTDPTFTIDPPLETSGSFEVEVTSGSGSSAIIEYFVLANSGSVDPNNDSQSNIEDLYFAAAMLWLTSDTTYDVDGSGKVGVNDLLYTFPATNAP